MHVTYQGQRHQARDARAPLPALARLPLQSQRAQAPRHTRHCPAQIQDRHIYQRLFLARPRRLQILCNAQEQHPILGEENRTQQTARHRKTHPTAPPRLAHNHHLGVRTLTKESPHHPTGSGTDPEQNLPTE